MDNLKGVSGIELIQTEQDRQSAYWLFTIYVEDRTGFARKMGEKGIMVSRVHERNDKHSCVEEFKTDLPVLDEVIHRMICFSGETLIPLVNGKVEKIKDLVGKKFFVYSYDLKNKKIVIGKAHSCKLTRKNTGLVKIILENGFEIKCTEDHPFLLSNGKYKKAGSLKSNDSLMPLYRKIHKYDDKVQVKQIHYKPKPKWQFVYHLADEYNLNVGVYEVEHGSMCHHINLNPYDDTPSNINRLSRSEHNRLHVSIRNKVSIEKGEHCWQNPEFIKKEKVRKSIFMKEFVKRDDFNLKDPRLKKKVAKINSKRLLDDSKKGIHIFQSDKIKQMVKKRMKNNNPSKMKDPKVSFKANVLTRVEKVILKSIEEFGHCDENTYMRSRPSRGFPTWKVASKLLSQGLISLNHRVLLVEKNIENNNVYDFAVDTFNNFAIVADRSKKLCSGIFVHNCIPVGWWVSEEDRQYIVDSIKEGW